MAAKRNSRDWPGLAGTIRTMLEGGGSKEDIAAATGLPLSQVKACMTYHGLMEWQKFSSASIADVNYPDEVAWLNDYCRAHRLTGSAGLIAAVRALQAQEAPHD